MAPGRAADKKERKQETSKPKAAEKKTSLLQRVQTRLDPEDLQQLQQKRQKTMNELFSPKGKFEAKPAAEVEQKVIASSGSTGSSDQPLGPAEEAAPAKGLDEKPPVQQQVVEVPESPSPESKQPQKQTSFIQTPHMHLCIAKRFRMTPRAASLRLCRKQMDCRWGKKTWPI